MTRHNLYANNLTRIVLRRCQNAGRSPTLDGNKTLPRNLLQLQHFLTNKGR